MNKQIGRPGISARVAIGAMIIKHLKCLSDEATIEEIKENPYLQYFLGYEDYGIKRAFDPSLFVTIRNRMGFEAFTEFNVALINKVKEIKQKQAIHAEAGKKKKDKKDGSKTSVLPTGQNKETDKEKLAEVENKEAVKEETAKENQGIMLLDATVADQKIPYPNDINLLNECREKCEELIDSIYPESGLKKKPRDHRRKARKAYLNVAKKKNRSFQTIRKGIKQQLNYVRRDIALIHQLLDKYESRSFPLNVREQRLFWVIQELFRQQEKMYKEKVHKCEDRIVNIYQPYVRPIVRGKNGRKVEFGSKVNIGLVDGMAMVSKISYDAYNESIYLPQQVEQYKRTFGFYPKVVVTDQIYGTRENRKWLKGKEIIYSGKPLGRPPKETEENREELKEIKEQLKRYQNKRSEIEGKFGQGKNFYGLNEIDARTYSTSISWIMATFFGLNIIRALKEISHFIFVFFKTWFIKLKSEKMFSEKLESITFGQPNYAPFPLDA
ncbi:MAG: IS5 family transposase [Bacteroidetes bacterium]|nr:IS5 family transposase [Bacteroidota bacterium]